jgi:peptidoglycan/xylan/chitin deacetylase (PgdA/CDA1 family)
MSYDVCITIDLEQDAPPFMSTYRGIEEGAPRLLSLFAEESIRATFFTTGDVARRYPRFVEALVAAGHELGCHGDSHRRFSTMTRDEARDELRDAGQTLRQHAEVISFRAPNLDLPNDYVPLLAEAGFAVDSSFGRHKRGSYFVKPVVTDGVRRIPASISPSPLRTPGPLRDFLCGLLESPAVLFFHPWEFVDLTRAPLRFDIRARTGDPALRSLRDTIRYFKRRNARFLRMRDVKV